MGLYSDYILPKYINSGMQSDDFAAERKKYIPLAHGVVLDVGAGSATNIPYFAGGVQKVLALEPSDKLWALGAERIAAAAFPVERLNASAEAIPLPDASVDTVVTAWSLCSIPNVAQALKEMRRVLKPGGTYIFMDHGKAHNKFTHWWQWLFRPACCWIGGGCHIDRSVPELIKSAGFTITKLDEGPGLKPLMYLYRGTAVPNK